MIRRNLCKNKRHLKVKVRMKVRDNINLTNLLNIDVISLLNIMLNLTSLLASSFKVWEGQSEKKNTLELFENFLTSK